MESSSVSALIALCSRQLTSVFCLYADSARRTSGGRAILSRQRELLTLLASKAAPCLPLTAKQVHQQQPVHAAIFHMGRGRPAAV